MKRPDFLQKLLTRQYFSSWIILLFDVIISTVCTFIACLVVRFITRIIIPADYLIPIELIVFFINLIIFYIFKTSHSIVRHSTLHEILNIGIAVLVKNAIMILVYYFIVEEFWMDDFPITLVAISDIMLTFIALVFVRIFMLLIYEQLRRNNRKSKNILVYGFNNPSISLVTRLRDNDKYNILGFFIPDSMKKLNRISGLPTYSCTDEESFEVIITRHNIYGILFPDYASVQLEKDKIINYSGKTGVKVFVIPPINELGEDIKLFHSMREIKIEDFLERTEIDINMDEVSSCFKGKTILITGSAGSIGSELCRQLANLQVKKMILFDSAETPSHEIRIELEEKFPLLNFETIVGDIRIKQRLEMVFKKFSPQIVFHAAAYKHVPLMEENPCEAILVNVFGTCNVADLSVEYGVEKMIMISTDKAVNPTNIMGASKRLAEIYVQSLGNAIAHQEVKGNTQFVTTRFGNVLGSNGSVIPRFRQQIEKGGPVTVTHPRITRFFMTIPEACRLVMEAATIGFDNEIFVFNMGEPVIIADLAKRMIEMSGFVPNKDIMIEYTGLRPGEKLFEEVLSNEENTLPTSNVNIRTAIAKQYDYTLIQKDIKRIIRLSLKVNIPETVKLLKCLIPEFKSKNSIFEQYDV